MPSMASVGSMLKRVLLGRQMESARLEHPLLPKVLALPVFSSDPLSSVAYATEEMMLVLVTAGAAALSLMMPLAGVIVLVLAIVVTSYRQTVRAYPRGGGSYIVARENLGTVPGLGAAAVSSAAPGLTGQRVPVALAFIVVIALANLRGVRESGTLFAVPTYGFVILVYVTIASGLVRCLGGCPRAETADLPLEAGAGLLFFVLQIFTALILIVAANTAYQDFPRLSAILAGDRFVPSQFRNRGDRLVFSNGVIVLSLLAALLVWAFDASLTSLIPLYLVGVFTAFTLSQAGMVRRWVSRKEPRWVRNAVINAIGATTTGIVLVVAILTRFREGAWMVVAALPVIVLLFLGVKPHYDAVARELNRGKLRFGETGRNHVVFVIMGFGAATAEALGYIRSLRPAGLEPLYVGRGPLEDAQARWSELAGDAAPLVVPGPGDPVDAVIHFVRGIPRAPEDFITVVIPELFRKRSLISALMMPVTFRLKVRLLREPQVVITDVPVLQEDGQPEGVDARPLIPERVEALVFVAMPHDAAVRAVNYAVSLNAHEIRAVFLATDPEEAPEVLRRWAELGIDVRLEIVDAPFRDLGPPLLNEVRRVDMRRSPSSGRRPRRKQRSDICSASRA